MSDAATKSEDQVQVVEEVVVLNPAGKLQLTLEQKLALFEPAKHGGEFMSVSPVGREQLAG